MRGVATPLIASLLAQAAAAFTALTPAVFAVAAAPDLGIAARDVGGFTVILFFAASISAVGGGALVADVGPIRTTQFCLLAGAVGIAMTATASLPLAALGGLIVGLGYGPMTPASSHMLARVTLDRWRPFVFSLKQTGVPLGGMLAGAAVPALVAGFGWRGAALMVAAVSLCLAVALQPLRTRLDGARQGRGHTLGPVFTDAARAVRRNPRLRALGFTSLLYSAMQLSLGAYLVTFLVEEAGFSLLIAGLVLSIAQGAGVAGRLVWGALAGRMISARRLLAVLGLVMAAAALAIGQVGTDWPFALIAAVAAVFGASAVGWNGLYLAEIVRVTSPAEAARATGAVLFFTFGGMALGPAVFAGIAAASNYTAAFAAVALAVLMQALFLLMPERPSQTGG